MAKEAVENPGTADTPVDLDQLKAALGCPLCGDMYRFPVTVVRALPRIPSPRETLDRGVSQSGGWCPIT